MKSGDVGVLIKAPKLRIRDVLIPKIFRDGSREGWEAFAMTLYTPMTWIQVKSALAAEEFRLLTVKDVSDEMVKPWLRIVAKPSDADFRLVIRDVGGVQIVQPLSSGPCSEAMPFGEESRPDCEEFRFALQEVQQLSAAAGGEFLVTVRAVGSASDDGIERRGTVQRDFKIDRSVLTRLPGLIVK